MTEQSKPRWQVEDKGMIFGSEPLKSIPNPATTSPPNASAKVRKIQFPKVGQHTIMQKAKAKGTHLHQKDHGAGPYASPSIDPQANC